MGPLDCQLPAYLELSIDGGTGYHSNVSRFEDMMGLKNCLQVLIELCLRGFVIGSIIVLGLGSV